MTKSIPEDFVRMAEHVCPVCNKAHTHNTEILISKRLTSIKGSVVTGWGLCEEHQNLADEDYIAMVAIDPSKSERIGDNIKPEGAYHLGKIAHIRRTAWANIFNVPAPKEDFIYCSDETITLLESIQL